MKGKREVHKLKSAERGGLITVVLCMSASGIFIEPMVIFPRKRRCDDLGNDLPKECILGFSPTGWITSELFAQWFLHFIEKIHACEENPAVLILDGHFSHTRNLNVINLARSHHVSLVSLPPHTSGKTQPLDVSFMKAFKSYYARNVETWMDSNQGRVLTHFTVGKLFTSAYEQAAAIPIAKGGFAKTGIYEFNSQIFENDPKLIKVQTNTSNDNAASQTANLETPRRERPHQETPTNTDEEDNPEIMPETPVAGPSTLVTVSHIPLAKSSDLFRISPH